MSLIVAVKQSENKDIDVVITNTGLLNAHVTNIQLKLST